MGKGEIALYEQFLLFPQYFQKTCTADTQKKKDRACLGKGYDKSLTNNNIVSIRREIHRLSIILSFQREMFVSIWAYT